MIIEVGKWKTRCGVVVAITHKTAPAGKWGGKIEGMDYLWADDGSFQPSGRTHALDLISSWEDSKTEIKAESKMDGNIGDRVTIEGVVCAKTGDMASIEIGGKYIWLPVSAIKSVEPAPPAVGDIVSWDQERPLEIFGVRNNDVWREHSANPEDATCERLAAMLRRPGFQIIKRAEPK